ncbi:MAG TPA: arylsulfotransferase family protein, partial [Solirubrobacteraceae bacterium]|nr:arylsulfotransferase family protein [Solirubrobacteraceae bacterium]
MLHKRSCITRCVPRLCQRTRLATGILLATFLPLVFLHAAPADAQVSITTWPSLTPAFNPGVYNYVIRCQSGTRMWVYVAANETPVSVDGQTARTGSFFAPVTLSTGQRFTLLVGSGSDAASYNVRCLPQDFPKYTFQLLDQPQAAYYLVTPNSYVTLFDTNGVPVWWFHQPDGFPVDANLMPNGDLSWAMMTNIETFGFPGAVHVEERDLDGNLIRTFGMAGTPTDHHEALPLPNGDFLIDSYVLQIGGGTTLRPNVLDGSFQDVRPDGSVAYAWNSAGSVTAADTQIWLGTPYPGMQGTVWDWQHLNSVEPYNAGYLISMRNTNAIYYVRASDDAIVWKLGGTTTPQSLKIIGDPNASTDFGGQHDARAWPDGTISVHDNGTGRGRPPRVLRFDIDASAGTATLVQMISDPAVTSSPCDGSARLLPRGNWV